MTVAERTPPRPLAPVLARIALGLALVAGGAGLSWRGLHVTPMPGLKPVRTPLDLPLNGAGALNVRLEGNRTNLGVEGLAWPGRGAVVGSALHRERNPLAADVTREGRTLDVDLRLDVKPLQEGVIRLGTPSLQHKLETRLSRSVPVTLTTDTYSGDTRLDLHALRVRALDVRAGFGEVTATLPERQSGPMTFVTLGGAVTLRAPAAWRSPSLRVNTESGDVRLNLGTARADTVNVGTRSGEVTGDLPRADRVSVTTGTGDVGLHVPDGAAGTLDIRSEGGLVTLAVPRGLALRVRFTGRGEVQLPPELRREGNAAVTLPRPADGPDLDVFLDAPQSRITLRDLTPEGEPQP